MNKPTPFYPAPHVDAHGHGIASQAGGMLLTQTAIASGLMAGLSEAMVPWRKPLSRHDPGKVLVDLALSLAMGGDCISDVNRLRSQPAIYGPVASNPTISRLIATLSGPDLDKALAAINAARAKAREHVWTLAGEHSPAHGRTPEDPLVVDLDASIVISHSEKEEAMPTWKKTFGHHPLAGMLDHGAEGTGEGLSMQLRAGNAGSNTAADHIAVTQAALEQLPAAYRSGRQTMVRTDSAGGTHKFLDWLTDPERDLSYSVGFTITEAIAEVLPLIPEEGWTQAYNNDGYERDGAWLADITGMLDLSTWPKGLRVVVRKEKPHVGAQLRITDIDGMRYTAFATNQTRGQHAALELRHRLRARCEDRIRNAKDTGLENLPLQAFTGNTLWCHLVLMALDLLAWMQMLGLTGTQARVWEPKKLRAQLFEVAGKISTHARKRTLHFAAAPHTDLLLMALNRLSVLSPP
ncbi:IS1380 family transposase [Glutamicibacter sp. BW80]|uniref:IS1380 family transposase n=2 Tax=unclassified Glutamicibacter TaxID=2627139 RepID=UPI000BB9A490|nr:IS1380 family transposase [Glutamicibacter sp. BW80]PCC30219.1 IS1380 family transposase [Glutamicibacter sp. BW80]